MDSRQLPNSTETERAVLGAVLVHQDRALRELAGRLAPEDLYAPAHALIFAAMLAAAEEGEPVDAVTVEQRLRADGHLGRAGGLEAIAKLAEDCSPVSSLQHHAGILRDKAALRGLIRACADISARAHDGEESNGLIRQAGELVRSCSRVHVESSNMRDLVRQHAEACEHRWHHPEDAQPLGVPTGLHVLDSMLQFDGLPLGHVTIVAADTTAGKSALVQAFMRNACKLGRRCLDITLEDKQMARAVRHISAEGRLHNKSQQSQIVHADEWGEFTRTCVEVSRWAENMFFVDRAVAKRLAIDDLLAVASRMVDEHEIDEVVIDYLQLVNSGKDFKNTQQHVDYVFDRIEGWASQHEQTATVLVSQMNRRDRNTRPELRNLYHSAKLEQGAHTVFLIWAPDVPRKDIYCRAVDVAKQKDGPTGLRVVGWQGRSVVWFDADDRAADEYLGLLKGYGVM